MTRRPLSNQELRHLLRKSYAPEAAAPPVTRRRPSIPWLTLLFLIGAASGAGASARWRSSPVKNANGPHDPVEAVQGAASRYAEALSQLASATSGSAPSAIEAREVAANSFVGVARSLMTVVGETPNAIGLYRLASEVRHGVAPEPTGTERGAAF